MRQDVLDHRNAYRCQIEVIRWVVADLPVVNGLLKKMPSVAQTYSNLQVEGPYNKFLGGEPDMPRAG